MDALGKNMPEDSVLPAPSGKAAASSSGDSTGAPRVSHSAPDTEQPLSQKAPPPAVLSSTLDMAELLLLGLDKSSLGLGRRAQAGDGGAEHWIGRLVGDYRIEKELGRGGMGTVFRAHNVRVGSTVALKLLRFSPGRSAERLRRFELEAKAAAELNHPNIINVFDVGQVGDLYYLAMEYFEGRSLAERLKDGPLDPPQAVRIAMDLCSALGCAHSAGVIHRDIKPSNILIETSGRAQLMDFGLARSLAEEGSGKPLTESGSIMGTAHYMSPEQARGLSHLADSRSDLYSLGAVLYEMVTGRMPFDGPSTLEVIRKVAREEPVPPRKRRPELDPDLETIILKAMEKNPARRYRGAQAMSEDLFCYQTGEPIHSRPPSAVYRLRKCLGRHRTVSLTVAIAALILLLIVAGFLFHEHRLVGKVQAQTQRQSQVRLDETLRRRLLEIEADELKHPHLERWRLVHALRLSGRPREALAELQSWAERPPPPGSARGSEAERLLWCGILALETGQAGFREDLRKAQREAEAAKRPAVAAAAKLYLGETAESGAEERSGEARSFLEYHRGHAALLKGDTGLSVKCFRRVLAGARQGLESRCALLELRRLTKERPDDQN